MIEHRRNRTYPELPGGDERFVGYGVMAQPFAAAHATLDGVGLR